MSGGLGALGALGAAGPGGGGLGQELGCSRSGLGLTKHLRPFHPRILAVLVGPGSGVWALGKEEPQLGRGEAEVAQAGAGRGEMEDGSQRALASEGCTSREGEAGARPGGGGRSP